MLLLWCSVCDSCVVSEGCVPVSGTAMLISVVFCLGLLWYTLVVDIGDKINMLDSYVSYSGTVVAVSYYGDRSIVVAIFDSYRGYCCVDIWVRNHFLLKAVIS